jgi:type II secretory pathway component GspD/PulD (secretin)
MKYLIILLLLNVLSCSSIKHKEVQTKKSFNKYLKEASICSQIENTGFKNKRLILDKLTGNELRKYDFMFLDTPIKEALVEISSAAGISIVADESVVGVVSITINKRNVIEILEMISSTGPFDFKKENGYYFIGMVEIDNLNWTKLTYNYHYKTRHLYPSQIKKSINPVFRKYLSTDDRLGNLTITANRKNIHNIYGQIVNLDTKSAQIVLEVTVSEVTRKGSVTIGGILGENFPEGNIGDLVSTFTGGLSNVVQAFSALEEDGELNVKANPTIMVQEGEVANFTSLVRDYYYGPKSGQHKPKKKNGKHNYFDSEDYVETGVRLKIIPTLGLNNEIKLVIPEIALGDFAKVKKNRIIEHKISTTIKVKHGEMIMIGGMIQDSELVSVTKVPEVGDLPFINLFFKDEYNEKEMTEVVFLIRPQIKCQV